MKLLRSRSPDERDFRVLFDENFDDVWRYVRRRCASGEDADDIVAETFAIAWRRWSAVPLGGSSRLWLFGTARNVLANHHRGTRRHKRLEVKLAAQPPVVTPDPADTDSLEATRTWRALAELSEPDREILLLRGWEGLRVDEIAEVVGCSANAASQRLGKARDRLRSTLATQTGSNGARTGTERAPETEGGRR